jgi:hypothetical protein
MVWKINVMETVFSYENLLQRKQWNPPSAKNKRKEKTSRAMTLLFRSL